MLRIEETNAAAAVAAAEGRLRDDWHLPRSVMTNPVAASDSTYLDASTSNSSFIRYRSTNRLHLHNWLSINDNVNRCISH